ncbi:thiamine transport system permease protein [Marinospirillum celere]|uniref:Thiamine transport system permease protein n=1 Tax=Marinospirillum celere TaxID=1122252 RepID=A0A1I1DRV2_9GAMM|nr:ABC transporter permease subunit [Marinospirillum celere]SFB77749.1 thiamine transport system permease protein [Marinospirillum celere]
MTSIFPRLPLLLAVTLLFGISLLALLALTGWEATPETQLWQDPWFWQVLRFTLWQAFLSSLLSVGLALPLARALALDQKLPGKAVFLRWCLLCFVMPSLILITGLVLVFGRNGWLTPWLTSGWQLYGLSGILLAHVFLNLPFALRVLSFQWAAIPPSAWKLAAQLHLTPWQRFCLVELPALRALLPGLFGFIFLLCFNSFAVVLALGGGPATSTLEVAIYQALKYNFNPSEALFLAWTQLLIAGGLFWLFSRWSRLEWLAPSSSADAWRPSAHPLTLWVGRLIYGLVLLFLTLPILSLLPRAFSRGLDGLPWMALLQASGWSLLFAVSATLIATGLGLWLAWQSVTLVSLRWKRLLEVVALHYLVIPGMVLSVGIYIFFMHRINWLEWGWLAVILLNALLALPFVFYQLKPVVQDYQASYQRLAASLGLSWGLHWHLVVLPFLKPALQRVAGLCFVLALGDFAIFGIFGQPQQRTLPWLIYDLAASYRLVEAALASLGLLLLAFIGLALLERSAAQSSAKTPRRT